MSTYGEVVKHYTEVNEEVVPPEFGEGVTIRWLIREEDGAKSFAMRYFRMKPGGKIKPHTHPWEHEIFVLKGKVRVMVGGREYVVSSGYFIYIPPNVMHGFSNEWDEDAEFLCMIPIRPTA